MTGAISDKQGLRAVIVYDVDEDSHFATALAIPSRKVLEDPRQEPDPFLTYASSRVLPFILCESANG